MSDNVLAPTLPALDTRRPTRPNFCVGARVHCYSASRAGGPGTVEDCDDRLVRVRLDS